MKFELTKAKNGMDTCLFDGHFFHSSYDPEKEAREFVKKIQSGFQPEWIFVIEPGLSYCAAELRKTFPNSKICAIRISSFFAETNFLWDRVFNFYEGETGNRILFSVGDEGLLSSVTVSWTGAKSVFKKENDIIWKEILDSSKKAASMLYTRNGFSKKWFLNTINFLVKIKNTAFFLRKTEKEVLICASGPSLLHSLPYIKKFRKNFFIICLSSALSVLVQEKIIPDLTLSTDGGFWAKFHLQKLSSPLALSCEGNALHSNFSEFPVLPLVYPESMGEFLFKNLNIPFFYARRNGTVSGTALEFAMQITEKNIYFCGLDLSPSPSFQHAEPNELEKYSSKNDFRLSTKETRLTASRFNSASSLTIYRNWFSENSSLFSDRVFRLSAKKYSSSLGNIKDLTWEDLDFPSDINKKTDKESLFIQKTISINEKKLMNAVLLLEQQDFFLREVFPVESIMLKRASTTDQKDEIYKKINKSLAEINAKVKNIICSHQKHPSA